MMALISGGCTIDALTWAGEYQEAVDLTLQVIEFLDRAWNDYFLGGIWLSALGLAALADRAEQTRLVGGDPAPTSLSARLCFERTVETARRGRPRGGRLGPEGRAWMARARAEYSRLIGEDDLRCGGRRSTNSTVRFPVRGRAHPMAAGRRPGRDRRNRRGAGRGGRALADAAADGCRGRWPRGAQLGGGPGSSCRSAPGGRPAHRSRGRGAPPGGEGPDQPAGRASSCSSAPRRSACTCPTCCRNSASAGARRRSRSPTNEGCSRSNGPASRYGTDCRCDCADTGASGRRPGRLSGRPDAMSPRCGVPGDDVLQAAIDELYSADPDEFMQRRGALVAAAKKSGAAAVGKQIAALRKPTRSAYTVNRLARSDPDGIAELIDLGGQLREAERSVDAEADPGADGPSPAAGGRVDQAGVRGHLR